MKMEICSQCADPTNKGIKVNGEIVCTKCATIFDGVKGYENLKAFLKGEPKMDEKICRIYKDQKNDWTILWYVGKKCEWKMGYSKKELIEFARKEGFTHYFNQMEKMKRRIPK